MTTKIVQPSTTIQAGAEKEAPMDFRGFFLYRLVGAHTQPKRRITRNSVFVKID